MLSLDEHLLSIVIWLPIFGGFLVLFAGGESRIEIARTLSIGIALATFILSLPLYIGFDATTPSMQFVERSVWIETFNIEYYLGIDGISMPLIILTTFVSIVVVIAGWTAGNGRFSQYMAAFLILEGVMIGVFSSLDAILFYVFWEAMLIPMFLIIGDLGRRQSGIRDDQVFSLYPAWIVTHVGRDPVFIPKRGQEFLDPRLSRGTIVFARADFDLSCVLRGVRCQGANVSSAYLAAGRARAGTNRWVRRTCRDYVEDGRVWVP